MKKIINLTVMAILLLCFYGCGKIVTPTNIKIKFINILDNEFNILKTISDEKEIEKFISYWKDRTSLKSVPHANWDYKLDIESDNSSLRWLYSKDGFCALLNYQLQPVYQLNLYKEFNNYLEKLTKQSSGLSSAANADPKG